MDNIPPPVSVIIPTYNRASLLKRSIRSVLDQTFQKFEIIVVDDASTDNTEEVVRGIGESCIRYVKHEKNSGGSAARNTGIRQARGRYIAFQDSDDEWLPEKLEKQMRIMEVAPPQVGVVYTGFWRFCKGNREYIPGPEIQVREGDLQKELLRGNFVGTPTVVVRAECFQRVGVFDYTMPRLQDWEIFLRIAKKYEFRYVSEPLVHSYFTEGSISSNQKAYTRALEILLAKHSEEYKVYKSIYRHKLLEISTLYRLDNDIKKSREFLIKAIKVKIKVKTILTLLVSFLGINFINFYWKLIGRNSDHE